MERIRIAIGKTQTSLVVFVYSTAAAVRRPASSCERS